MTLLDPKKSSPSLTKLVKEKENNWDVFLEAMLFSLRSKVHTTTKSSPFLLMYGREAVFPSEVPIDLAVKSILLPEEETYATFLEDKKTAMETINVLTLENICKTQEKHKGYI